MPVGQSDSAHTLTIVSETTTGTPPTTARRALHGVLAGVAVLVLAAGAFLGVRTVRARAADTGRAGAATPASPAIEDAYGIRLDGVLLTAAGGMLEVRYTVVDDQKALALHDDLPFVVLDDGTKLDQPGMAGHGGHQKTAAAIGRGEYNLLANAKGAARAGEVVSVHIGGLALDGVTVQG